MKIVVAEDEIQKLVHIKEVLSASFPSAEVRVARSVRSAIDLIEDFQPVMVILDMSLPTFDVDVGEAGGRPQGFGGIEVMRYLDFIEVHTDVFVLTAYEGFEDDRRVVDLTGLREELHMEHAESFRGAVHYDGLGGEWRQELLVLFDASGHHGDK